MEREPAEFLVQILAAVTNMQQAQRMAMHTLNTRLEHVQMMEQRLQDMYEKQHVQDKMLKEWFVLFYIVLIFVALLLLKAYVLDHFHT
jgi:hypothetical protein